MILFTIKKIGVKIHSLRPIFHYFLFLPIFNKRLYKTIPLVEQNETWLEHCIYVDLLRKFTVQYSFLCANFYYMVCRFWAFQLKKQICMLDPNSECKCIKIAGQNSFSKLTFLYFYILVLTTEKFIHYCSLVQKFEFFAYMPTNDGGNLTSSWP